MTVAVIAADPPWQCKDQLPGKGRGASKHYKTMPVDAIQRLADSHRGQVRISMSGTRRNIADDAILFLWRLSSMPTEALAVAQWWGFTPKSELVWVKHRPCAECVEQWGFARGSGPVNGTGSQIVECEACDGTGCGTRWFGMGRYTRAAHETCIIATRGKMASKILDHSIPSVLNAPVPWNHTTNRAIHSAKPERFYADIVEKLAAGPYLELFGRRRRPGWTVLGNQVGKLQKVA